MNQTAANVETLPDRVSCLVATLSDGKMLIPITAVAEVINTVMMPEGGNDQTALYGWVNWRDQRIPLISLEKARGGDRPPLKLENRMAVLNAVADAAGLGFYAVLLQSLPTPIQVNTDILRDQDAAAGDLALAQVAVGEEFMTLTDLLAVEKVVSAFNKK